MRREHVNPYSAYLEEEVRKARLRRDLAVAQWILDTADAIGHGVSNFVAKILRLEMRRDDAWVESMETKLRQHQPY